jgi:predicted secreted protein
MDLIQTLKWIAVFVTLGFGLYTMVKPGAIEGFTGLAPSSPRGITEIRAVMGGTFVGLGIAAVVLNTPQTFKMLGICYAVIAIIRTISMVLDKSVTRSNTISLIAETALAITLVFFCILSLTSIACAYKMRLYPPILQVIWWILNKMVLPP